MGILGVSDIAEKLKNLDPQALAKKFPKMQGSEVLNDINMTDPGKKGQVVQLNNKFSIASNVTYYKSHYKSRDWSMMVDKSLGFSGPHTLVFNKGKQRVNIVVSREQGKTSITANLVKKGVLAW